MKGANASLYDSDFYLWTQQAAERLLAGNLTAEDLEHAAGELSDMGKRDRRELQSRMKVLVMHLMKWAAQPQMRETSTWLATINEQRTQIEGVLEQSPSLRALLVIDLPSVYAKAARQAAIETKLPVETFRIAEQRVASDVANVDRLLSEDFLPEDMECL